MKIKNKRLKKIIMSDVFDRVVWALMVGLLFVVAGDVIQRAISDNTESGYYYSLKSPIEVEDRDFVPGENMELTTSRTSRIDVGAIVNRELALIKANGDQREVYQDQVPLVIDQGNRQVSFIIRLPDEIEPGKYKWSGAVSFNVRGSEKVVYWESELFDVKVVDNGNSPDTQIN